MNNAPVMDSEGLAFFKNQLSRSSCYLEYGCGGSTAYASNVAKVKLIISVDTDSNWIKKIREETAASGINLHLDHVDVGELGDWGAPKTTKRYLDFYKYSVVPWKRAAELNAVPDTVLIDGRFRVACFLYSLIAARVGTTIMFDDYFNRPDYFVVEKFCSIDRRTGRAAIFNVNKQFNINELVCEYARHTLDWK